ncbi:MAG: hypothetical protein K9I37_00505 [Crocinitomicaceae bacterium]|nr:hypothetical protein [Crocinitomicaceae bacterium]
MNTKIVLLFILICHCVTGQSQLEPIGSYFKDQLYKKNTCASFLPISKSQEKWTCSFGERQNDTLLPVKTKRFRDGHLIKVKGEDFKLEISPLFNFSLGKDLLDSSNQFLYQNSRGIIILGDITPRFSFSTSFYENQARFSSYENSYMKEHGEIYPTVNNQYNVQNAVVPGAARTKPFKNGGFDYGYAIGNFVFRATKNITVMAGNNQQFIGAGYRSLLLSDNAVGSPYIRVDYQFFPRWTFNYLRSRLLNLVRKPNYTTVEGNYQAKGLAVNYISFAATSRLTISLFDGAIWAKGDSLKTSALNPLYYSPVPFLAHLVSDSTAYAITGLNFNWLITSNIRLYGQAAFARWKKIETAFQLGGRSYEFVGLKSLFMQMEYNQVSSHMYQAPAQFLSYSQYNLPLAHTKGNGFREIVFRINWRWKSFGIEGKSIVYQLIDHQKNTLLPITKYSDNENNWLALEQVELSYQINKKLNLSVFSNLTYRFNSPSIDQKNLLLNAGIRTSLINHYNDY